MHRILSESMFSPRKKVERQKRHMIHDNDQHLHHNDRLRLRHLLNKHKKRKRKGNSRNSSTDKLQMVGSGQPVPTHVRNMRNDSSNHLRQLAAGNLVKEKMNEKNNSKANGLIASDSNKHIKFADETISKQHSSDDDDGGIVFFVPKDEVDLTTNTSDAEPDMQATECEKTLPWKRSTEKQAAATNNDEDEEAMTMAAVPLWYNNRLRAVGSEPTIPSPILRRSNETKKSVPDSLALAATQQVEGHPDTSTPRHDEYYDEFATCSILPWEKRESDSRVEDVREKSYAQSEGDVAAVAHNPPWRRVEGEGDQPEEEGEARKSAMSSAKPKEEDGFSTACSIDETMITEL